MKFHLILLFFYSLFCNGQQIYNVKDFGAVPNDNKDDWEAFQKCIDSAISISEVPYIFVPEGEYIISDELIFDFLEKKVSFIGENKNGKIPVVKSVSKKNLIWAKGFLFTPSKGIFIIKNFKIIGNNTPYTPVHNKINKPEWNAVILITDKNQAYVDNVIVENHYGQGIHISTTQQEGIDLSGRFDKVVIQNSKILDVWGHHPKSDSYGDAIYLSNVKSAEIKNNIIFNNLSQTKQFGRAGIVVEYMAENVKIIKNKILGGYDRPLHIEATYGGHLVENNQFKGSDMGLIIAENLSNQYQSSIIRNNLFTNEGLIKDENLRKSYGYGSYGDRALVYIVTNGESSLQMKFEKNHFIVKDDYEYETNAIINNRSSNIIFESNSFHSGNRKGLGVFNYGKGILKKNKIQKTIFVK